MSDSARDAEKAERKAAKEAEKRARAVAKSRARRGASGAELAVVAARGRATAARVAVCTG